MSTYDPDCEKPGSYTPDDALRASSDCARLMQTVFSGLTDRLDDLFTSVAREWNEVNMQLKRKVGTYARDVRKQMGIVDQAFVMHIANEMADAGTYLAAVMTDIGVPTDPPAYQRKDLEPLVPLPQLWEPLADPLTPKPPTGQMPMAGGIDNAQNGIPSSVQIAPTARPANLPQAAAQTIPSAGAVQGREPPIMGNQSIVLTPGQNVIQITGAPGQPTIQIVLNLTVQPAPVYLMPTPTTDEAPDLLQGLSGPRGGAEDIPLAAPLETASAVQIGVSGQLPEERIVEDWQDVATAEVEVDWEEYL